MIVPRMVDEQDTRTLHGNMRNLKYVGQHSYITANIQDFIKCENKSFKQNLTENKLNTWRHCGRTEGQKKFSLRLRFKHGLGCW